MTREQILEIVEKYKLRMPPTAFYELKADIVNFEEPTTKNNLGVDCISREQAINAVNMCSNSETILNLQQLPSVTLQESILDEIRDKIQAIYIGNRNGYGIMADVLKIIDKYRTESEDDV